VSGASPPRPTRLHCPPWAQRQGRVVHPGAGLSHAMVRGCTRLHSVMCTAVGTGAARRTWSRSGWRATSGSPGSSQRHQRWDAARRPRDRDVCTCVRTPDMSTPAPYQPHTTCAHQSPEGEVGRAASKGSGTAIQAHRSNPMRCEQPAASLAGGSLRSAATTPRHSTRVREHVSGARGVSATQTDKFRFTVFRQPVSDCVACVQVRDRPAVSCGSLLHGPVH
jgi:hypothetical protein